MLFRGGRRDAGRECCEGVSDGVEEVVMGVSEGVVVVVGVPVDDEAFSTVGVVEVGVFAEGVEVALRTGMVV